MKTVITILIAVLMLLIATSAMAAQSATVSYTDSYRWHGFGAFGDDYVHPGISTQLGDIDIGATSHVHDLDRDLKYWDTAVGYTLPIGGLQVRAGYDYLILPGSDVQELSATISLPGIIVPRLTAYHIIPDEADAGQIYSGGVDVAIGSPDAVSAVLGCDVTYNDGVNPFGPAIRDWTHATAGLTVNVPLGETLSLQPGVFYQYSFEPEALQCDEDEVWYAISLKYAF